MSRPPKKKFICRHVTDHSVVMPRGGRPVTWKLNTKDAQEGRWRRRGAAGQGRSSFLHYIAAGGLRQLRRSHADDLAERSASRFFILLGVLLLGWILFYFLPCK